MMKKEYIKPIFEEQVLSVDMFLMAEESTVNNSHVIPFPAPTKRTNPF